MVTQHGVHSVGAAFGSNEAAARKRVDRVLEKLHAFLRAHGAALSAAALVTTLSAQAMTAAPAGLAAGLSKCRTGRCGHERRNDPDGKSKQLYQALQTEAQLALANAGLSPDYQLVPTLNFRNFASEAAAERNLQLLDAIYERAIARSGSFLSEAEIVKFGEFRTKAINGNRMALSVNRKLMSPSP